MNWPGVTSPGMPRQPTVTWPGGRASGLRDARLGLARCGAIQRADGLAELPVNPQRAAAALPPPLLLGAFDPLLLGWASRDSCRRPAPARRHSQRLVPAVRAGRRPGRGDLEHHARPGRARTVQPAGRRDPGGAGRRRRRRDTVPGRIAGPAGCYIRRGPTSPRARSSAHRHIAPIIWQSGRADAIATWSTDQHVRAALSLATRSRGVRTRLVPAQGSLVITNALVASGVPGTGTVLVTQPSR